MLCSNPCTAFDGCVTPPPFLSQSLATVWAWVPPVSDRWRPGTVSTLWVTVWTKLVLWYLNLDVVKKEHTWFLTPAVSLTSCVPLGESWHFSESYFLLYKMGVLNCFQNVVQGLQRSLKSFNGVCEIKTIFITILFCYLPILFSFAHIRRLWCFDSLLTQTNT